MGFLNRAYATGIQAAYAHFKIIKSRGTCIEPYTLNLYVSLLNYYTPLFPQLSIQDVLMQLPSDSLLETDSETFCKETAGFLPHVTYSIQSSVSPPSSSLRRKIDVCGAVNSMGNGVFFTLKSTSAKKTGMSLMVETFHWQCYHTSSIILLSSQ